MTQHFDVIDASGWIKHRDEYLGATTKGWLLPPDASETTPEWLWKEATVETTGLRRTLGHDWGERCATEVAIALGVPCADVQLAGRDGVRGTLTRSFASARAGGPTLSNASELLPNVVPEYPASQTGEVPGYTLDAAWAVLDGVGAPRGSSATIGNGRDGFTGFLVLDALIANQDRHHDNWGVLQLSDGSSVLAPAFDQACCLGYQETQDVKQEKLNGGLVEQWASRGRARQFETRPRLTDLAVEALSRCPEAVAAYWAAQVEGLAPSAVEAIVERVPVDLMSQWDRRFAVRVVETNQRRLLDAWHDH